jgi:deferrochelatase/peroxidase EfeB
MCAGQGVGSGALPSDPASPPDDTGEALGLSASRLTITVGLGPGVFDGRFGLASQRPEALADLPTFPGDALDPARSGGDLCLQACADDPQVAVHAIRNLARLAHGTAGVRWSQLGFGRTSSTSTSQATPRNMFGFKDGTRNITAEDTTALHDHVWVQPGDGPAWMTGGSYLVARRIPMDIEVWDRTSLTDQQVTIGRSKGEGAPIGRRHEHDTPDLALMDPRAHVRLAHPDSNDGSRILRRGYSFVDGSDGLGHLDAGLFFLAYQRDLRTGFIRLQQRLAGQANDRLNEYITHDGSAIFAVPPGLSGPDDHYARALLEA